METQSTTPTAFGPYDVLRAIGQGGTAKVYMARHNLSGEVVAVKVGPEFMELEPGALERFRREFTALRGLRHPHLVAVRAVDEEHGVPFIVMEYVAGQNLEQRLQSGGALAIDQAVALFLQIAQGLGYLHDHYLVHRDIKPSNIFLDGAEQAKLGDFGLLKDLTAPGQITLSHRSMGTVDYGAPEQFEDAKHVDCRCDLFSLAATFYTALTAKFPFGHGAPMQIMQRKLLQQYVPLRLLLPSLDPEIDRLVHRCLSPKVEERPGSCEEFIAVLRDSKPPREPSGVDEEMLLRAASKPAGGAERRASVRFDVALTANFVPFHQKMRGRWQSTILDISSTGIRLQSARPIAVNSVLQIALGADGAAELVLVRWVKAGEGDTLIVGGAFVRPLSATQLEAIRYSAN